VVIGVHTPEYPWEKPLSSVKNAVNKWQLPYRVVTDNNYQIWNAFGNQYWPAHYYFDAKGSCAIPPLAKVTMSNRKRLSSSCSKKPAHNRIRAGVEPR
jgi:hypothetical protein